MRPKAFLLFLCSLDATEHGFRTGEKDGAVVWSLTDDDVIEEFIEDFADLCAAQAKGKKIPAVDGELIEGKAVVFRLQFFCFPPGGVKGIAALRNTPRGVGTAVREGNFDEFIKQFIAEGGEQAAEFRLPHGKVRIVQFNEPNDLALGLFIASQGVQRLLCERRAVDGVPVKVVAPIRADGMAHAFADIVKQDG